MFLNFLVSAIIVQIVSSQQSSPCPKILSYESRNLEDDRWYAVLTLESDEDLTGIFINIRLDRPAQLLGNWFGDITSADNKEFLIHDDKYRIRARQPITIRFFVKFNRAEIIPSVSLIRFNGKTVCSSESSSVIEAINKVESSGIVMRPTTTQVPYNENRPIRERPVSIIDSRPSSTDRPIRLPTSSTQRYRENQKTNGLSTNDDDYFRGDFAETLSPSPNKPSLQSSTEDDEDGDDCGVATLEAAPLISKGQDTWPGQWPWHVSLYHSKGLQLQYICGGTLISKQHVLTAAHCVTKPSTERVVNKSNLLVYLGKYKLISFGSEVQDRDVSNIIVHPDYNATSYFNDIALLKLSRKVQITNYVRTCCLWDENTEFNNVVNRVGTVVGWGFDEYKKLSNKLMQAQMPVVSRDKCIDSNTDFFYKYTSDKNFCAGYRNGTTVCNGDSGGGLVFPKKSRNSQTTVWQLRGLVSIGVALQTGQGVCDSSQYIIFTDVAKYTHWIRQVISY